MEWKRTVTGLLKAVQVPLYGAGFKKPEVDITDHPKLLSFDGYSVYFFDLNEKEAAKLLNGITFLNGYNGWLAYILQEVFYDERFGDELYESLLDGLYSGILEIPPHLSRESVYSWVENIAPEVEKLKRMVMTLPGIKEP